MLAFGREVLRFTGGCRSYGVGMRRQCKMTRVGELKKGSTGECIFWLFNCGYHEKDHGSCQLVQNFLHPHTASPDLS